MQPVGHRLDKLSCHVFWEKQFPLETTLSAQKFFILQLEMFDFLVTLFFKKLCVCEHAVAWAIALMLRSEKAFVEVVLSFHLDVASRD